MPQDSQQRAIADEIVTHYGHYDESQRLTDGFGLFERERTRELMARYLPPPPAVVLDVGGATGVYAFWLAGLGYQVHLVDITPRHIEQAEQRSRAPGSPQLASLRIGDARALDLADHSADAVVMHGPLYHLTERRDRLQALAEARRVLRPGGVLLAFAITRYAGVVYGLTKGYVFDAGYKRMTEREVKTGLRRDAPEWLGTFISAYFHHPDELAAEVIEAGLAHEGTLGVLGPAWLVPDLDASWQDEEKRRTLMAIARLLEGESVLGPRLMAVARKEGKKSSGGKGMPFPTCKITVLKTLFHEDLADEYRRPDVHRGPCPFFTVGQEFTVKYLAERPEGFACDWAWDDIHKIVLAMMVKGDFGTWMKDPNTFITCCTDGVKPVIFKIERVES